MTAMIASSPKASASQIEGPLVALTQCHLAKFDLGGGVSLRGVLPGGRQDQLAWQTMAW
jgi:hypothetical protein